MRLIILILIMIFASFCFSTEYNIVVSSPFNDLNYSSAALFSDSCYYQAFVSEGISDNEIYMNYVIGDTIMRTLFVNVDTAGLYPKQIEIASDNFGKCHAVWTVGINNRSSILYTKCADTTFAFSPSYVIDSFKFTAGEEWLEYPDIAVSSDDSRFVGIAFTRVFATSGLIDSSWIELTVSSDYGNSFPAPLKVNFPSNRMQNPRVQMSDSTVFVLFNYGVGAALKLYMLKLSPPYSSAGMQFFPIDTVRLNPTMADLAIKNDTLFFTYSAFNNAYNRMNIISGRVSVEGLGFENRYINPESRNQLHPSLMVNSAGEPRIFYCDSILNNPFVLLSSYSSIDDTFYSDWIFSLGSYEARRRYYPVYSSDSEYFLSGLMSYDSTGYILSCRSKPNDAPGPIAPIVVNTDTLSKWYSDASFRIDWKNPFDYSGIMKTLYKFYTPPVSDFDTSGSRIDTFMVLNLPAEGNDTIYFWDLDNRMNTDYMTNRFAVLKFDSSAPHIPQGLYPSNNQLITDESRSVPFSLTDCFDSISGIAEYRFYMAYGSDMGAAELCYMYDSNFIIDTNVLDMPFMDGLYTWRAEALDSARNTSSSIEYAFTLIGTPKPSLVSPADEETITFPHVFTFRPVTGYDNAINNYRYEVSSDSLFGAVVYASNIFDTTFILDSITTEKAYWRVIPINEKDFICKPSDVRTFHKSKIVSGDFEITAVMPLQIHIGDELHVKIIPNMVQCDVSSAVIAFQSGDTIRLKEFLTDSFPDFIYSNTPIIGISDTLGIATLICTPDEAQYDTVVKEIKIIYPAEWIREEDVVLYPNPCAGDSINLKIISYKNAEVRVNTYDLKGNIIANDVFDISAGEKRVKIKLDSEFESDLYFMRIEVIIEEGTRVFKRKFVRVK